MRLLALLVVLAGVAASPPDARFKTDLLLFVAHPDDDTLPETYLAKLIVDEGKRVSVVYATPGDSGGNEQGPERGPSLGLVRQVEVRRGLAALGVTNIWILNGHDTAGQDPLRSLANWDHGRALADAVRLIRLTRPEVVLTWMPMQVAGENHGDHQASSVLATEAFDLAGDPTAFPEQLAAPTQMFENLLEGLAPWQPKKLYFMSDAITTEFMGGHGPSYPVTATSKEGKRYWEYSYEALKSHATQFRGQNEALAKADRDTRERMLIHAAPGDALIDPLRFVRGKSHVGGAVGGDVFEGVTADPIVFAAAPGFRPAPSAALTVGLGGPWRFYRSFWRAHGLDQMPAIDLHDFGPVSSGSPVHVPLLVTNGSDAAREVTVTAQLPDGWHEAARAGAVVVPARGEVELTSTISGARPQTGDVVEVHYVVQGAADVVPLSVRVYFRPHGNVLPQ